MAHWRHEGSPTARILPVASAADAPLIDVRQDKDGFAAQNAEIIRAIHREARRSK